MHTTEGKKYRFFHNGDFSGDVKIMEIKTGEIVAEVPFDDLKRIVASMLMYERIAKIEQMEDDELLGL
jgi:hypothetical protein